MNNNLIDFEDEKQYLEIGDPKNTIVKKPVELMMLKGEKYTLSLALLLDEVLANFDFKSETPKPLQLRKRDIETLLKRNRIRNEDMVELYKSLSAQVSCSIPLNEDNKTRKGMVFSLFERFEWEYDNKGTVNGKSITILPTTTLTQMMNKLGQQGAQYFSYKAALGRECSNIKSYRLAMYILTRKYRKKWTESLTSLREILDCVDKYDQDKQFVFRVLNTSVQDINNGSFFRIRHKVDYRTGTVLFEIEDDFRDNNAVKDFEASSPSPLTKETSPIAEIARCFAEPPSDEAVSKPLTIASYRQQLDAPQKQRV